MEDRLYPAPLNSVGVPPGPSGKQYHGRQMVLAWLEWPSYTEVVPAVVDWREADRVRIEWSPRNGGPPRHTWLPAGHVIPRLRLNR